MQELRLCYEVRERHEKGSGVRIVKLFAEITSKFWLKWSMAGRRLCREGK